MTVERDETGFDAAGQAVDFHRDRAGRKAVLVFYRSAVW